MESEISKITPPSWEVLPIEAVCKRITSGGTPSRRNPDFYKNGSWPWVKTQELLDGWIDETEEHITQDAVDNSSAKVLPAKTVLIAMYGATVGQLGILRREMTCNQACCAFLVDEDKADYLYLYYQLLLHRRQLKDAAVGAAQQNLNSQVLRGFRLPFPPLETQRAIAHVLGTLDDKIELNRRTNQTLEAMAKALFKSWFVDFDPVRAKAEGRQPEGMDAETAALFPDGFGEDGLPRGWRAGKLSDFIDVNPSRSLSKGTTAPYLDMGSMPTNSARALDWFDREYNGGAKFLNGDTLLARITPCLENGKTAFVDFLEDGQVGWGSTEYIVLRPKKPYPNEYAYFVARDENFREFAIRSMSGTSGRQRVQAEAISGYKIAIPDTATAKAFGDFAQSVMADMKARDLESRTLAALRDALLPKLLSGEVSVAAVEKMLEGKV